MTDTTDRIVTVARSSTDTWVFIVDRDRLRELPLSLVRYATNPELSLTWGQADRIWRGMKDAEGRVRV